METEILVGGLAAAPVIAALANVIKPALGIPSRFAALTALVLGVGWDLLAKAGDIGGLGDLSWGAVVMLGIMAGLSASGAYSATQPITSKALDVLKGTTENG